ncbi:MAG: RadC family protein [Holosporales bacterium]|jgi:DNA repair protein RadC
MTKAPAPSHALGHRARLRARLNNGNVLEDYELLELILFAAHPRGDTKPLAKALLKHCGGYAAVLRAEPATLMQVDGIGEAAVAAIKGVEAAALRLLEKDLREQPVLRNWQAVEAFCRARIGHNSIESLWILYLNSKNKLIKAVEEQRGTINQTPGYPREIARHALHNAASAVIMVHNHPSGDTTPSPEDITFTRAVRTALETVGVALLDHVIVSRNEALSFKNNGLL